MVNTYVITKAPGKFRCLACEEVIRLLHGSPYLCYVELREYSAKHDCTDDSETLAILANYECVERVEREGFPVVIDTINYRTWCGTKAIDYMRIQHGLPFKYHTH